MDIHNLLGVASDVDSVELRRLYRRALARAHPDNGGDVGSFLLLQNAWSKYSAGGVSVRRKVVVSRGALRHDGSILRFRVV